MLRRLLVEHGGLLAFKLWCFEESISINVIEWRVLNIHLSLISIFPYIKCICRIEKKRILGWHIFCLLIILFNTLQWWKITIQIWACDLLFFLSYVSFIPTHQNSVHKEGNTNNNSSLLDHQFILLIRKSTLYQFLSMCWIPSKIYQQWNNWSQLKFLRM